MIKIAGPFSPLVLYHSIEIATQTSLWIVTQCLKERLLDKPKERLRMRKYYVKYLHALLNLFAYSLLFSYIDAFWDRPATLKESVTRPKSVYVL